MNVEIGSEAAQFPEKKYTNEIFVAVHLTPKLLKSLHPFAQCTPPLPQVCIGEDLIFCNKN
jgi:hypothetical protein